jgi:hypothetical protein
LQKKEDSDRTYNIHDKLNTKSSFYKTKIQVLLSCLLSNTAINLVIGRGSNKSVYAALFGSGY